MGIGPGGRQLGIGTTKTGQPVPGVEQSQVDAPKPVTATLERLALILFLITLLQVPAGSAISLYLSRTQYSTLAFLGGVFIWLLGGKKLEFPKRSAPYALVGFVLAVVMLLSTALGSINGTIDWTFAIRDMRDYFFGFMFFIGYIVFSPTIRKFKWIAPFFVLYSALIVVVEAILWTQNSSLYLTLFRQPFLNYRHVAGFSGPNEYGAFLAIMGGAALMLVSKSRSRWMKAIFLAAALVFFYTCIADTGSRGALVGIVAAAGLWLFLPVFQSPSLGRIAIRVVGLIMVFILVIEVPIGTLFTDNITTRRFSSTSGLEPVMNYKMKAI